MPKKKGFEEEHKDSDDDSSDDEQVRPRLLSETRALGASGCDASFKGPWRPLAGERSPW